MLPSFESFLYREIRGIGMDLIRDHLFCIIIVVVVVVGFALGDFRVQAERLWTGRIRVRQLEVEPGTKQEKIECLCLIAWNALCL